jgi:hypothetical protein
MNVVKLKFSEDLCTIEPDFEIISDIANATKHMVLDSARRLPPFSVNGRLVSATSRASFTLPGGWAISN